MRNDLKSAVLAERTILPGSVLFWQVRPDAGSGERFQAGQHVEFELPTGTLMLSIASSPLRPRLLDFCLRLTASDAMIAAGVHMGARLVYRGPHGGFSLDRSAPGHLFIATGTGIAPIRSMLLQLWAEAPETPTLVLHGDRGPDLPPFAAELAEASNQAGRGYFLSLTGGAAAAAGESRRVTDLLRDSGPWWDAARAGHTAYVCGRADMVREAEAHLQALGFPPERIRFEGKAE